MKRVLRWCAAALAVLLLSSAGLFAAWLHGAHIPLAQGATYLRVTKLAPQTSADAVAGAPTGPFFILLVGNDSRAGVSGARGDALHVLGVNPRLHQASMLDIPRDTCWAGDKINVGNTRGPRAQADAVGGLLGVPLAYVVDVDFDGFTSLVDGVGGVDVNVPTQMHDSYSGAYFNPGVNHMSGDAALRFSRDRHDFATGDLVRSNNQGRLIIDAMRGLQKKSQTAAGEFHLLALLGRHAQLDGIGVSDLYRLGRLAFSLNADQIKNVTIPVVNGNCLPLGGGAGSLFADFRDNAVLESH